MTGRLPAPRSERRSHAERTAETRARIMAAVVESISEAGFGRTTAAEIARRAGVTWGAVQHHFGGKDGILVAVLEDSFQRFAKGLDDVPAEDAPLAERVSLFVDRAWEHFGGADYRSTFEILLNHRSTEGDPDGPPWQTQMLRAWNRIWQRIFGDARLSAARTVALQQYTIAALSGLASMKMLGGDRPPLGRAELALLKETLRRELAGEAPGD